MSTQTAIQPPLLRIRIPYGELDAIHNCFKDWGYRVDIDYKYHFEVISIYTTSMLDDKRVKALLLEYLV